MIKRKEVSDVTKPQSSIKSQLAEQVIFFSLCYLFETIHSNMKLILIITITIMTILVMMMIVIKVHIHVYI